MTHNIAQMDREIEHDEKAVTTWEKAAASRWGAYISEIEERTILKAHALSVEPTTALELGCEGGRWSKMLLDLHWTMICTEVNEKALALCKKRIPAANCILVGPNDTGIPCASESVDLLLCVEVPPVIRSDWFIDEAYRVLKPGGLMVGVFWNLFSFRGFLAHVRATLRGRVDYYKIAYPLWKQNLSKKGIDILSEEGYCWFLFNRVSDSRFVPYFTGLEKWLGLHRQANISPWVAFIAQKARSGFVDSQ